MYAHKSTHLSLWAGLGEDRTLSDAILGQGDTGPAMSGDDVLVSATLSPVQQNTLSEQPHLETWKSAPCSEVSFALAELSSTMPDSVLDYSATLFTTQRLHGVECDGKMVIIGSEDVEPDRDGLVQSFTWRLSN
jgi:hypothetical protein